MKFFANLKNIFSNKKGRRPKIGLALGSGGSKGFAHIGAIKMLEKNNIPIDAIAGSSLGAVIGAAYSLTRDIEKVEKIALDVKYGDFLSIFDFSFNKGLIEGKQVEKFLGKHLGKSTFADLQIPLKVVATNCQTAQPFIINEGKLVPALHASTCVPLAFLPKKWTDGTYLWDGGMSISIPADLVRKMGVDIVIAVNVDADYFSEIPPDLDMNFVKIGYLGIDMFRYHLAKYNVQNADVVIEPKLGNLAWYDLASRQAAIVAGEISAKSKIRKIKSLIK